MTGVSGASSSEVTEITNQKLPSNQHAFRKANSRVLVPYKGMSRYFIYSKLYTRGYGQLAYEKSTACNIWYLKYSSHVHENNSLICSIQWKILTFLGMVKLKQPGQ